MPMGVLLRYKVVITFYNIESEINIKTVQDNTEELAASYRGQQIDATFHLNPGNHYKEALERTTAGIAWL